MNNLKTDFGIDFVVTTDLPNERQYKAPGGSYDITCPFCGSKRKFNVNPRKNVARCNKCSGDKGYNTVTLHAELTGLSTKEAYKDLLRLWNGLSGEEKVEIKAKKKAYDEVKEISPAPLEIRDKAYRRLLSKLDLSTKHHEDLIKRGLTEEEIESGMYKTVPVCGLHSLALHAIEGLEIKEGQGIPGFVDVTDPRKVLLRARKNGYFVPVRTKDGLISGMQIRYDNLKDTASEKEKETYKKYSWYSSSEKMTGCGVTGCENIHFAGNWADVPKKCCITEGVLKADIASFLSGDPYIGLVGVNNVSQLSDTLSSLMKGGLESVYIYVDMDYRDKYEVKSALDSIKRKINMSGKLSIKIDGKARIREEGDSILFMTDKEIPKESCLYLDKFLVPKEKVEFVKNGFLINKEYLKEVRNTSHTLTVINGRGIDTENISRELIDKLFKKRTVVSIPFTKKGLSYHVMTWDEDYKGIDDYLLYLKKKK